MLQRGVLICVCAALVLPCAGIAKAEQNQVCNADEIHWTINGPTSIAFSWRGNATAIQYGLTVDYGQSKTGTTPKPLPFSSAGPFRRALLRGLKTDVLYHYKIGSCGDHTFRTPPARGSSNFIMDVEGDVGASTNYEDVVPDQQIIAAHLPSAVLVLGDLTYGSPHGQAAVDRHFNDVMIWSQDAAYMPVWGNHEWTNSTRDDLRNYKGRFILPHAQTSPGAPAPGCCGADWSWFDYGNARFISFPEPYTSTTWASWYKKARRVMDRAQADPRITFIVTFGHRAPYTSGHHDNDMVLRNYITLLAASHSKYLLNVNGHNHDYERTYPQNGGLVSVTAGIGGSELEESKTECLFRVCPKPAWSAFRAMHFGILQLSFTPTEIDGSFICGPAGGGKNDVECTSGSVIDRFTIHTHK